MAFVPCIARGTDGKYQTRVSPRNARCSHPQSTCLGPLHGYAITGLIRRHSDDALILEEGTLYPALWRLESKGLVEAEWGLSENKRKAKFYHLTPEGRRYLRSEVKTWEAYAAAVSKVLSASKPALAGKAG